MWGPWYMRYEQDKTIDSAGTKVVSYTNTVGDATTECSRMTIGDVELK